MEKTLKQIVTSIETFADSHKGIKQFEAKPLSEFTADGYLYPLMWLEIVNITFSINEAKIKINAYFVDRLNSDYTNFIKIVSDTLKLCDDFYSYFTEYEEDFGFYFNNNAPITPIEYAFDDNVAGNKIEITVQVALKRNKNQVPI